MSDLTQIERKKLEKLFQMEGGFILDFSNRSLSDFIFEHTEKDIYHKEYSDKGDSKANRLRVFWKKEPNYIVAKIISVLLEYFVEIIISNVGWNEEREELYKIGLRTSERLRSEIGEHIEAIQIESADKDFTRVGKSIRQLINENKPEEALDRLHTYFAMFIHQLCDKHAIKYDKNKAINSLLGEYIKHLQASGQLESIMAEKIMKYSINLIDAFNDVRNNKSLAHPNQVLGFEESLLIFRTVSGIIAFISANEKKYYILKQNIVNENTTDDLPF